jgi:hypothetical protein
MDAEGVTSRPRVADGLMLGMNWAASSPLRCSLMTGIAFGLFPAPRGGPVTRAAQ